MEAAVLLSVQYNLNRTSFAHVTLVATQQIRDRSDTRGSRHIWSVHIFQYGVQRMCAGADMTPPFAFIF